MSDLSSSQTRQTSGRRATQRARRNGKADFLLLEADIRRGLAAGQSMRFIYEAHHTALSFGYIQFTKYVKTLIRTKSAAFMPPCSDRFSPPLPAGPAPSPAIPAVPSLRPHQPRQARAEETQRFHFDPMAVDSKDLI